MIPIALMYSQKELTVKQFFFRRVLQLLSIEVILYLFGYGISNIKKEPLGQTVAFGVSILVAFVLEEIISGVINSNDAKKLNKLLEQYQK